MWWYGSLSVSRLNLAILFIKWLRRLNDKNDLLKYICRVCSDSVVCFVWNEITSILYLFYNQTAIANQVLTFLCSYFLSAWAPALFIRYSHFYVHTFWVHGPQLFLSKVSWLNWYAIWYIHMNGQFEHFRVSLVV
jgi:hypothetical protein